MTDFESPVKASDELGDTELEGKDFCPNPARLRELFDAHYDSTWRLLRRLGVPASGADDAAQQVFMVVARRINDVKIGSERSFLYGTALRVAPRFRARFQAEERESAEALVEQDAAPDALLEQHRARAFLHKILDSMTPDLRTAFVLFEMEGLTTTEIAQTLAIPLGTVASRLRRGREQFYAELRAAGFSEGDGAP